MEVAKRLSQCISDGPDSLEEGSGGMMNNPPITHTFPLIKGMSIPAYTEFREWLREFVSKGSNIVTDEMYDQIRLFLRSDAQKGKKGQTGDAKFRHSVRKKKYFLVNNPQLDLHDVVFTLNDKGQPRRLVPLEEIVNVLYEIHVLHTNHGGIRKTHRTLSDYYAGIPEKVVRQFLLMCSHCTLQHNDEEKGLRASAELQMHRGPRPRSHPRQIHIKQSAAPMQIWTNLQVRFLNMEKFPHNGCHWIMHLKDTVSHYTILHPLQSLDAHSIATSLVLYFSILSPPTFIQPLQDEYVNFLNRVLQLLHVVWPKSKIRMAPKPPDLSQPPEPESHLSELHSSKQDFSSDRYGSHLESCSGLQSQSKDTSDVFHHQLIEQQGDWNENSEEDQERDWEENEVENEEDKEDEIMNHCNTENKDQIVGRARILFPLNDYLHAFLRNFCIKHQRFDWSSFLPIAQCELNMKPRALSKECAFTMMFHRKNKTGEIDTKTEKQIGIANESDKKRKSLENLSFPLTTPCSLINSNSCSNSNSKVNSFLSDGNVSASIVPEVNYCNKFQKTCHPSLHHPDSDMPAPPAACIDATPDVALPDSSKSLHFVSDMAKTVGIKNVHLPLPNSDPFESQDVQNWVSSSPALALDGGRASHFNPFLSHFPAPNVISQLPRDESVLPPDSNLLSNSLHFSKIDMANLMLHPHPNSGMTKNVSTSSSITADGNPGDMDDAILMNRVNLLEAFSALVNQPSKTNVASLDKFTKEVEDSQCCMSGYTDVNPASELSLYDISQKNTIPTAKVPFTSPCQVSEEGSEAFISTSVPPPSSNIWNSSELWYMNSSPFSSATPFHSSSIPNFSAFGNGEIVNCTTYGSDNALNISRNVMSPSIYNDACRNDPFGYNNVLNNSNLYEKDCSMCNMDPSLPSFFPTTNELDQAPSLAQAYQTPVSDYITVATSQQQHQSTSDLVPDSELNPSFNSGSHDELSTYLSSSPDPSSLVSFMDFASLDQFTNLLLEAWVDLEELNKMEDQDLMSLGLPPGACKKLKRALARWPASRQKGRNFGNDADH